MKKKNKERKYYRICPYCNTRQEQSKMIRTNFSTNGWMCKQCYNEIIEHGMQDYQEYNEF